MKPQLLQALVTLTKAKVAELELAKTEAQREVACATRLSSVPGVFTHTVELDSRKAWAKLKRVERHLKQWRATHLAAIDDLKDLRDQEGWLRIPSLIELYRLNEDSKSSDESPVKFKRGEPPNVVHLD